MNHYIRRLVVLMTLSHFLFNLGIDYAAQSLLTNFRKVNSKTIDHFINDMNDYETFLMNKNIKPFSIINFYSHFEFYLYISDSSGWP